MNSSTFLESLQEQFKQHSKIISEKDATISLLNKDLNYNISLISKRDEEIAKYSSAFTQIKESILSRDQEIADSHKKLYQYKVNEKKYQDTIGFLEKEVESLKLEKQNSSDTISTLYDQIDKLSIQNQKHQISADSLIKNIHEQWAKQKEEMSSKISSLSSQNSEQNQTILALSSENTNLKDTTQQNLATIAQLEKSHSKISSLQASQLKDFEHKFLLLSSKINQIISETHPLSSSNYSSLVEFKSQLKEVLHKWHQTTKEKQDLSFQYEDLLKEKNRLAYSFSSLSSQHTQLKETFQKLTSQNAQIQPLILSLPAKDTEIEQLKQQIVHLNQQNSLLNKQKQQELISKNDNLNKELENMEKHYQEKIATVISSHKITINSLKTEHENVLFKLKNDFEQDFDQEKQNWNKKLENINQQHSHEIQQLTQQVQQKQNQISYLNQQIQDSLIQQQKISFILQDFKKQKENMNEEKSIFVTKQKNFVNIINSLNLKQQKLEGNIQQLSNELMKKEQMILHSKQQFNINDNFISEIKQEKIDLQKKNRELENSFSQIQVEMSELTKKVKELNQNKEKNDIILNEMKQNKIELQNNLNESENLFTELKQKINQKENQIDENKKSFIEQQQILANNEKQINFLKQTIIDMNSKKSNQLPPNHSDNIPNFSLMNDDTQNQKKDKNIVSDIYYEPLSLSSLSSPTLLSGHKFPVNNIQEFPVNTIQVDNQQNLALQDENIKLRDAIKEMRIEMEKMEKMTMDMNIPCQNCTDKEQKISELQTTLNQLNNFRDQIIEKYTLLESYNQKIQKTTKQYHHRISTLSWLLSSSTHTFKSALSIISRQNIVLREEIAYSLSGEDMSPIKAWLQDLKKIDEQIFNSIHEVEVENEKELARNQNNSISFLTPPPLLSFPTLSKNKKQISSSINSNNQNIPHIQSSDSIENTPSTEQHQENQKITILPNSESTPTTKNQENITSESVVGSSQNISNIQPFVNKLGPVLLPQRVKPLTNSEKTTASQQQVMKKLHNQQEKKLELLKRKRDVAESYKRRQEEFEKSKSHPN